MTQDSAVKDAGDVLTVNEAAARIRVSRETILRWIYKGRLKARKPGGEWRINVKDLDAMGEEGAA